MENGYYELRRSSNDKYMFSLKSPTHETLLMSELYNSRQNAENGIASVRANSANHAHYQHKLASNGKHYFVLKAMNHQIIGTSQMYKDETAMENGIQLSMANGISTEVKDLIPA